MELDITTAQGALTGERYLASLKDDRAVWLNGERVDVTTHPAFAGMRHELARLYDLQHTPEYRERMTFVSPDTGNRVSYSYLPPRTLDDLLAKRRNCEIWMTESWGQLPRAPDFMSNVAVGLYDFREHLRGNNPRFGDNAVRSIAIAGSAGGQASAKEPGLLPLPCAPAMTQSVIKATSH